MGDHGENAVAGLRHAGGSAIGYKLGALTLLLLLGLGGYAVYSEQRFRELGEVLEANVSTYQRQRWERPVLRGEPLEDNAAAEVLALVGAVPPLGEQERAALAAHLYRVTPLDDALKARISEHRVTLAKLRAATRHPYAMTVLDVARGDAMAVPDYPRVMDAALMLLATGLSYDPRGCLELVADAVRVGQDLVPGAPLEAASVAMRISSVAGPLLSACAAAADEQTLRRAASDFHSLATHAPPVGTGIELLDVATRVELHARGELSGGSPLRRLRERSAVFEMWPYFERPSRFREITPDRYPDALETWKREADYRSRSGYPEVAAATAGVLGWLYDDMRGQALLRGMTIGLATLGERLRRGQLPREPVSLREPELRDPFNGQPLQWRVAQDGSELSIWSVGEDLRDDKGSSEWSAQAPLDVVLRFPLRSPNPPPPPGKRGKKARRNRPR